MVTVLAVEPNPEQAAGLRQLVQRMHGTELILVDDNDAAVAALERQRPALMLTSPLLAPRDEVELLARLRALPDGDRIHTVSAPLFSTTETGAEEATLFAATLATYLGCPAPVPGTARRARDRRAPAVRARIAAATSAVWSACRAVATAVWASSQVRVGIMASFVALSASPQPFGAHAARAVLEIRTTATDSEILIDGASRGRGPLTLLLSPGYHIVTARRKSELCTFPLHVAARSHIVQYIAWPAARPVGTLRVNSSPAGARVTIDGRVRGVTPLTIDDLSPGTHKVFLQSEAGAVGASAIVTKGESATLDLRIFSGWIAVFAPVRLEIRENGRVLGTSESGRIMIPPGRHVLQLANRERAYESTHTVDVTPGSVVPISILTVP